MSDMEQYFRVVKPNLEEKKVSMETKYLSSNTKL